MLDVTLGRHLAQSQSMLFAHLKRILRLGGFGYAAHAARKMSSRIAQNLGRLAKSRPPPPALDACLAKPKEEMQRELNLWSARYHSPKVA